LLHSGSGADFCFKFLNVHGYHYFVYLLGVFNMKNDEAKPTPSLSLTSDPNGVKAALFLMQRRSRVHET
jgi:hypothetical protein